MTKSSHLDLKSEYLVLYLNFGATDADKVQMCADLVALDVEIQFRYDELDLQELLDKNMVSLHINTWTDRHISETDRHLPLIERDSSLGGQTVKRHYL